MSEHITNRDAAVDIVVPTRGRGPRIQVLIESILMSNYPDFTLWIIDQSDDDETEQAIRPYTETDPRIRYERTLTRGSNIARNTGAQLGRAPFIIFTDDDCRVTPEWLGAMIDEFERDSSWAVFGRILADEKIDFELADHSLAIMFPIAIKDDDDRQVFEGDATDLDFGHGANMGFRRECFEMLNGFDNLLGSGGTFRAWPERDIGFRILVKGGRIVYTPEAILYHTQWRDWQQLREIIRNYAFGTGAAIGKFLRCGHWEALPLLADWFFNQGLRQVASGILKWHSRAKIEVGLVHLIVPWFGMAKSLRFAVNRKDMLYQ
ncbi:MAG: glycosyltransferase family 2 protein [Candidatus Promineifilaceae bacterium]